MNMTRLKYLVLKDYPYRIKCFFFPRHSVVRGTIPRTWVDSDFLIEKLLFVIVVEFFEKEMGGIDEINKELDSLRKIVVKDDFLRANALMWLQFYEWLIKVYNYIKVERVFLEGRAYDMKNPNWINDEEKLQKEDDKWLKEIVENRGFFWT